MKLLREQIVCLVHGEMDREMPILPGSGHPGQRVGIQISLLKKKTKEGIEGSHFPPYGCFFQSLPMEGGKIATDQKLVHGAYRGGGKVILRIISLAQKGEESFQVRPIALNRPGREITLHLQVNDKILTGLNQCLFPAHFFCNATPTSCIYQRPRGRGFREIPLIFPPSTSPYPRCWPRCPHDVIFV